MAGRRRAPAQKKDMITDSAQLAVECARRSIADGEMRSSVPIGSAAYDSEGLSPRSRLATSREAELRSKEEFIEHYKSAIGSASKDPLAIPDGMISKEYGTLWAMATCKEKPNPSNLRRLESKGWRYILADEAPGLAYYDHLHGLRDDAEHCYNGGLVAMKRYHELNDMEIKHYKKISDNQSQALNSQMRTKNGDLHPFSINSRNQFADDFLNHNPVGHDFRMALQDQ